MNDRATRYGLPGPPKKRSQTVMPRGSYALFLSAGIIGTVLAFWQLSQNSVYFLTPAELSARAAEIHAAGRDVRVGGMVEVGSLQWDADQVRAQFVLSDLAESRFIVHYSGLLPDMFDEGGGVVVEGIIDNSGKIFKARNLMVKHSEEYQPPDHHTEANHDLLRRSMLPGQENNNPQTPSFGVGSSAYDPPPPAMEPSSPGSSPAEADLTGAPRRVTTP